MTQKTVQKLLLHKITVNVTVVKRMREESGMEKLNHILLASYGIHTQVIHSSPSKIINY